MPFCNAHFAVGCGLVGEAGVLACGVQGIQEAVEVGTARAPQHKFSLHPGREGSGQGVQAARIQAGNPRPEHPREACTR